VIGPAVFAGYYDNPEANAKAFRDGWFRTGDLGHMDEEGFVYITGRASDMYISGGSNIYPREVEEKISPILRSARSPCSACPTRSGARSALPSASRARALRRERGGAGGVLAPKVPRYKMPKRFFFWEALPKSGYGKIPKRLVRDELEARGSARTRREVDGLAEAMRSIDQPGPARPERIQWVEARGRAFSFTLAAGLPLLEAARRGFAEAGFSGGVLSMRGGALGPFAYVMPALSKTGANAAFYSDTFRPSGIRG
jgi:hypothetical protein